jgi:hypothetical protein
MKTLTILLITVLSLFSCGKRDTINHYLTKPVTQQELIDNGFYKYSYTDTIDNKDKIKDTVRLIIRYDMYSNVKPEINKKKEVCPTQLVRFYREDSIKEKRNHDYLKNKLNDRIITYLFRNNSLFYKNIVVKSLDKPQKEIADLTTKEKIIRYYDSLNIPIKPIFENEFKKHPSLFLIDNYKTRIYYLEKEKYYDIFINYINGDSYHNTLETWYSGQMSHSRYYL